MPRVENGTREKTRTLSGAGLLPLCPELRGGGGAGCLRTAASFVLLDDFLPGPPAL